MSAPTSATSPRFPTLQRDDYLDRINDLDLDTLSSRSSRSFGTASTHSSCSTSQHSKSSDRRGTSKDQQQPIRPRKSSRRLKPNKSNLGIGIGSSSSSSSNYPRVGSSSLSAGIPEEQTGSPLVASSSCSSSSSASPTFSSASGSSSPLPSRSRSDHARFSPVVPSPPPSSSSSSSPAAGHSHTPFTSSPLLDEYYSSSANNTIDLVDQLTSGGSGATTSIGDLHNRRLSTLYQSVPIIPPSDSFNEALYRTTEPLSLKTPSRSQTVVSSPSTSSSCSSFDSAQLLPSSKASTSNQVRVMTREQDVQDSLNKLEGSSPTSSTSPTTPLVSTFSHHPSSLSTSSRAVLGSPDSRPESSDSQSNDTRSRTRSTGTRNSKDSYSRISASTSTQYMKDLAKGKRRRTNDSLNGGRNSRGSIATLASVMSSTGDSIYEDAIEGAGWTSVEEGEERKPEDDEKQLNSGDSDRIDEEEGEESFIDNLPPAMSEEAFLAAHPELRKSNSAIASSSSDRRYPPLSASASNQNIGLGFQRNTSGDSARSIPERRASLQVEYGSSTTRPKRLSLTTPSPSVIPLRRYSAVSRGNTPDLISPRLDGLDLSGSPEQVAGSASRRTSFVPKPLVLTPARTIVAPLTTAPLPNSTARSSVSPTPGMSINRRRSSDVYSAYSRRSSIDARSASPNAPVTHTRRLSSIGYVDSRRESVLSNGSQAFQNKWSERRKRSTSEDTGLTQTTESFGVGGRQTNSMGESPDSSVSEWSDERDKAAAMLTGHNGGGAIATSGGTSENGSPLMNDKEWENEYYRRTTTPLDAVAEVPDVSMTTSPNKKRNRDMPYYNLATPSIELSQASPVRSTYAPTSHARTSSETGRRSPASFSDVEHSDAPTPPPTVPLPGLPIGHQRHSVILPPSSSSCRNSSATVDPHSPLVARPPRIDSRHPRGVSSYDENWDGSAVLAHSSPSTMGTPGTDSQANSLAPSPLINGVTRPGRKSEAGFVHHETPKAKEVVEPSSPDRRASTGGLREYVPISIRPGKTADAAIHSVTKRLSMTFQKRATPTKDDQAVESLRSMPTESIRSVSQKSSRASMVEASKKSLGLAVWPPPDNGRTRTISAGPRLTQASDSSEGEASPAFGGEETDSTRPSNWSKREKMRRPSMGSISTMTSDRSSTAPFPRKPSLMLEPRDPRTRMRAGPDSFLEVLLTEPPPNNGSSLNGHHTGSLSGSIGSSAHGSVSPSLNDPNARWSHYSNGTSGSAGTPGTTSSGGHVFPSAHSSRSSGTTSPVMQQRYEEPRPQSPEEPKKQGAMNKFLGSFGRKTRPNSVLTNDIAADGSSTSIDSAAPRVRKPISIAPAGSLTSPRPNAGVKKPILIAPRASTSLLRPESALPPLPLPKDDLGTEPRSPDPFGHFPSGSPIITYTHTHNPPPLAPSAADFRRPLSTIDSRPESLISAQPSPAAGGYIPAFRSVSPLFNDTSVMKPADQQLQEELRSSSPVPPEPYADGIHMNNATPSAKSSMEDLRGTPRNFNLPPGLAPPLPNGAAASIAAAGGNRQKKSRPPLPTPIDTVRSQASLSISSTSSLASPPLSASDRARSPIPTPSPTDQRSQSSSIKSDAISHSTTRSQGSNGKRNGRRAGSAMRNRYAANEDDGYEGYQSVRQGPIGVRDVFRSQLLER